jgi:predicted O-methyltransferase YrrM
VERPASRPVPAPVAAAQREASRLGFTAACSDAVGRLLTALAAARPGGVVAESGTGTGVGTAWLLEGLTPDGRLVSVDHDVERLAAAGRVLRDDARR